MRFERFMPKGKRCLAAVSIRAQHVSLPLSAVEQMGNPAAVTVWWAEKERIAQFRPAHVDDDGAYKLGLRLRSRSPYVHCTAAIRQWHWSEGTYEWSVVENGRYLTFGPIPDAAGGGDGDGK